MARISSIYDCYSIQGRFLPHPGATTTPFRDYYERIHIYSSDSIHRRLLFHTGATTKTTSTYDYDPIQGLLGYHPGVDLNPNSGVNLMATSIIYPRTIHQIQMSALLYHTHSLAPPLCLSRTVREKPRSAHTHCPTVHCTVYIKHIII